jgi:hypothetical protein
MSNANPTRPDGPDWADIMIDRLVTRTDDLVTVGSRNFRCADWGEAQYAVEIIRDVFSEALNDVPRFKITEPEPPFPTSAREMAERIGQIGGRS